MAAQLNIFIWDRNWHRWTFFNNLFNPLELNMTISRLTRPHSPAHNEDVGDDGNFPGLSPAELIRETKDNMKMSEGGYKGQAVTLFTSSKV